MRGQKISIDNLEKTYIILRVREKREEEKK